MQEEAAAEELVHLDRIGTVPRPGDDLRATVYAPGMPEASRRHYGEDERFTLVDEDADITTCDVAVFSTRTQRSELTALVERFRVAADVPFVVLAHTGGEAIAVELVRQGAVCVLGEGDELALATVLNGLPASEGLLEAYDRNTATAAGDTAGRGQDPTTGLLDDLAMKAKLEELIHSGESPRIAFVRLLNLPRTPRELSYEGLGALRRRVATQFLHLTHRLDASIYALDNADFAILGADLSPNDAERLARNMQELVGAFAPSGVRPLTLAFGHAGPEAATEGSLLIELAGRARDLAAQDGHGGIVSAELLALGMASSTELQAALRVLDHVEQQSHHGHGHGERIADLAAVLATELGFEGLGRTRIRLAAHLHEIGKAQLPRDAVADPATLSGELLAAYRSHPILGARFVEPIAGTEVGALIRAYAERWDGTGFPDGIDGREIATGARIIAVAHAMEGVMQTAAREHGTTGAIPAAAAALRAMAGTRLDPEIVELAASMLTRGQIATPVLSLAS